MMEGRELTLKILEEVKNHYENTLVDDETDREGYNEVLKAIKWTKKKRN